MTPIQLVRLHFSRLPVNGARVSDKLVVGYTIHIKHKSLALTSLIENESCNQWNRFIDKRRKETRRSALVATTVRMSVTDRANWSHVELYILKMIAWKSFELDIITSPVSLLNSFYKSFPVIGLLISSVSESELASRYSGSDWPKYELASSHNNDNDDDNVIHGW